MKEVCYNKNMHKRFSKRGFTMVELSLSIAFIAVLSIAIVLIIANAVSAYHRGLTLNKINTAGRDLVDDIRGAVQNSGSISLVDGEDPPILIRETATITRKKGGGETEEMYNVPVFGAFCTGSYSYIWKSGYYNYDADDLVIERGVAPVFGDVTFKKSSGSLDKEELEKFRLLKIKDDSRKVCENYDAANKTFNFEVAGDDDDYITEILSYKDSENNLALYDLTVAPPADNGRSSFYQVSFVLGTIQGGINIQSNGGYCATPNEYNSALDYCAINKFSFAAQAIGDGR